MTLNRRLTQHEHVHQFIVMRNLDGWEVREEEDAAILRHVQHDDWHRVERDVGLFDIRVRDLKRRGWLETELPHARAVSTSGTPLA